MTNATVNTIRGGQGRVLCTFTDSFNCEQALVQVSSHNPRHPEMTLPWVPFIRPLIVSVAGEAEAVRIESDPDFTDDLTLYFAKDLN